MVRLCPAGGGLSSELEDRFGEAAAAYARGDYAAAATLYHSILGLSPHHPDALNMLGLIAQRAHKIALALTLFEAALAMRQDFPGACYNRAVALRLLGRRDEALQAARMAVDMRPNLAEAWDLAGQILKDKGDFTAARQAFAHALVLQPDNPRFHDNYALLLFTLGDLAAAYQAAHIAATLDPQHPPMIKGNILIAMGYPEQAAECFARARQLRPDFREAAASEAMARLQMGKYAEGWALWEQRPDLETILHAIPLWQGQQTPHLLLYEDQGLGDALQFLRYVRQVMPRAGRVTLRVREPLRVLCATNFPDIDIIGADEVPAGIGARCRLSSLPFFCGDIIPQAPYLAAPAQQKNQIKERLKAMSAPRLGLVWAGNPRFHHDDRRSMALSMFEPVLAQQSGHWISLQIGKPDDNGILAAHHVIDAAPWLQDFADTAAVIEQLDLVVTVDTAVAHLAGALGKPVFILLPFAADWRWLLGREDSMWYATARLLRQKKPGDWQGVIADLALLLDKFVAGDVSVLRPAAWRGEKLRQHPDALSLPS